MKAALYIRVSKDSQDTLPQLQALESYVKALNYEIYKTYVDHGYSGAKHKRPALAELMDDAWRRCFDIVLVFKFDRFARSLSHLIEALGFFESRHIDFVSISDKVDTSTSTGKLIFHVLGAVAQFERDLIRERIMAGLDTAKRKGIRLGAKIKVTPEIKEKIFNLRAQGMSLRQISKEVGFSFSHIGKILKVAADIKQ